MSNNKPQDRSLPGEFSNDTPPWETKKIKAPDASEDTQYEPGNPALDESTVLEPDALPADDSALKEGTDEISSQLRDALESINNDFPKARKE